MRFVVPMLVLFALLPSVATAQVVTKPADPTEKEVFDMLGSSMAQVFAKYGYPIDLGVTEAKSKQPKVRLDYGDYGFAIADKQVVECNEWDQLPGEAVLGIKVGDAVEDIEKKFGKPKTKITNAGGGGIIIWDDADHNRQIEVIFSKKDKCIGLSIMKK